MKNRKNVGFARILAAMLTVAVLALSALGLVSCGAGGDNYEMEDSGPSMMGGNTGNGKFDSTEDGFITDAEGDVISDERYVIKTVNTTVRSERYDDLLERVRQSTDSLGGYYSSASIRDNSYYHGGARSANIVIKIPADKLDELIAAISEEGALADYNEYVDDVTMEYIDLDSRIKTLEAEQTSLLSILEKTETVSDMMTVRDQLSSVQSDLASLRARKENLASRIAYSTVTLYLQEVKHLEPAEDASFGEELKSRFAGTATAIGNGFRAVVLWFLGDILYILIFAGLATAVFFVLRAVIKRKKGI